MTIDEALYVLNQAKKTIGGDKCLILCLIGSGISDATVEGMKLINDGVSTYVEVFVNHPEIQDN